MGPAYMFSRGVGTLRIDGYLTLVLLAHGELTAFHRLMKYGEPLSVRKAHPSIETYSLKCAAGLKTLLVEYLLMQNRYLTGKERHTKTREEMREAIGGLPLLIDLCLAVRSDPVGMIRGLGELVTCIYGPAVTYAFPDPLVMAYRLSVVHVSLISILDGAALNCCRQEDLRAQMSETVLFGKVKDPELVVCNFRDNCSAEWEENVRVPSRSIPSFATCFSTGEGEEGSLEDPGVDEEFRIHEKGIGKDTRARCPTRCRPPVPDGEKNEPGNEQPPGSPFHTRESHGRKTTKRIHERLGYFVHWILGSGVFPHV